MPEEETIQPPIPGTLRSHHDPAEERRGEERSAEGQGREGDGGRRRKPRVVREKGLSRQFQEHSGATTTRPMAYSLYIQFSAESGRQSREVRLARGAN